MKDVQQPNEGMGNRKSVLLVTVDCLRADHVGFMGYDRPTTPFLDTLSRESFVFPAAIVGGAPTYYSFPSILASRYPLAYGRDQVGLAPGELTLATALKSAGYVTAAFCAGNPYLSRRFGYDQGFDCFRDYLGADTGPLADAGEPISLPGGWASNLNRRLKAVSDRLGPARTLYNELYFQYCQRWATPSADSLDELRRFPAADVIVNDALSWLETAGSAPFFLWLHLMDPHSPYYPTRAALRSMGQDITPDRARYLNSYWNRSDLDPARLSCHCDAILSLYDAGVRWVDTQMALLVERLRQTGRWEQCVFALTADHGEEFLDHGGRYHPPDHLREELIRVPLILRAPGEPVRPVTKAPFSLLHLAPTLLHAAGRPVPDSFRGLDLWPSIQEGATWNSPAIAESVAGCINPFRADSRRGPRVLVIREEDYKLVLEFGRGHEALYDLTTDPQEKAALPAGTTKAVRRRLLEAAHNHLQLASSDQNVEARLRSRLRELRLEWTAPAPEKQPVAS